MEADDIVTLADTTSLPMKFFLDDLAKVLKKHSAEIHGHGGVELLIGVCEDTPEGKDLTFTACVEESGLRECILKDYTPPTRLTNWRTEAKQTGPYWFVNDDVADLALEKEVPIFTPNTMRVGTASSFFLLDGDVYCAATFNSDSGIAPDPTGVYYPRGFTVSYSFLTEDLWSPNGPPGNPEKCIIDVVCVTMT